MTIIAFSRFKVRQIKSLYELMSTVPLFEWIPMCHDVIVVTVILRMCIFFVSAFSGFQPIVKNIPREDLE